MAHYMKMSRLYAPTLKEDPTEAELISHKLLLRAGFIRKTAAGLYSYLPLAWRSLTKIENIIREEMEAIDAQELLMPILIPAERWHESGRWDAYGPELMRIQDRHERDFVMGPTHEEAFTDLVKNELRSYKQLPITLYQIQDKFRDEMRPRFGLMRGREFIMKDGYTFAANQEQLQQAYDDEKDAYARIALRAGIKALPVVADSGQIGGDTSVEFMALADAGEAELVWCEGYAADVEAATADVVNVGVAAGELERVHTPNTSTIAALSELLHIPEVSLTKALALINEDGDKIVCFVPGNHDLNDVKASNVFGAYHMMEEDELKAAGLVKGFIGPVNLPSDIRVCADISLKPAEAWCAGANEVDYHFNHVVMGRDFDEPEWVDVITAQAGDIHSETGQVLKSARGIEISQVFQLGTKYSKSMGATYLDADGKEKPFLMGCYGIGVSRMLAAIVEQHNDEHGIIWPMSVAPYHVEVIPLAVHDEICEPKALEVADKLSALGFEVLVDDRKERPGVKFADADLYGLPYQIICGKKAIEKGKLEFKNRSTGERQELELDEIIEILEAARA